MSVVTRAQYVAQRNEKIVDVNLLYAFYLTEVESTPLSIEDFIFFLDMWIEIARPSFHLFHAYWDTHFNVHTLRDSQGKIIAYF